MHTEAPISSLVYIILLASFSFFKAISQTIIVDQSGQGNYNTVQEAIDSVPSYNAQWINIQINPGTYNERVSIPQDKGFIFLQGSGQDQTIITSNGQGDDPKTTSTLSVFSDNFVARGIMFQNTYDNPVAVNDEIDYVHKAISVTVKGDRLSFYECGFISVQDTLWDYQGRHYYKSCYIEGLVDFIWGNGQSVFEDCTINVRGLPPGISSGFITAQGRESSSDAAGFVFIGGNILGSGLAFLGRAYRAYSRVIFTGTGMTGVVNPLGWDAWNYTGQEQNFFYAEVGCSGDGAYQGQRVSWETMNLTDAQIEPFSRENFIDQDGWIDQQPVNLL